MFRLCVRREGHAECLTSSLNADPDPKALHPTVLCTLGCKSTVITRAFGVVVVRIRMTIIALAVCSSHGTVSCQSTTMGGVHVDHFQAKKLKEASYAFQEMAG